MPKKKKKTRNRFTSKQGKEAGQTSKRSFAVEEAKKLNAEYLSLTLSSILERPEEDAVRLERDLSASLITRTAARVALSAFKGDMSALHLVLDRTIGKVAIEQKVEMNFHDQIMNYLYGPADG